jgi:putative membrane protein
MKLAPALAAAAAALGLVALSTSPSLAQPGGWGWHMWNGGGWMFLGHLVWIVVIAAVVALVVYAVRGSGGGGFTSAGSSKTPLEILDERFARGEIDEKEYKQRKKVLGS